MNRFVVLHLQEDDAAIYVNVDKIICFVSPTGKTFTEVFVQQTLANKDTTLGPTCFRVIEKSTDIAGLISKGETP